MDGRSGVLALTIGAGRAQRLLVEAGSTVVVLRGSLELRYPFAWLAERVAAPVVPLAEEEALMLECGGWVDLRAAGGADLIVMAPGRSSVWQRVRGLFKAVDIRQRTMPTLAGRNTTPVAEKTDGATAYGH